MIPSLTRLSLMGKGAINLQGQRESWLRMGCGLTCDQLPWMPEELAVGVELGEGEEIFVVCRGGSAQLGLRPGVVHFRETFLLSKKRLCIHRLLDLYSVLRRCTQRGHASDPVVQPSWCAIQLCWVTFLA